MLGNLAMKYVKSQERQFGFLDNFLIEALMITEDDLRELTKKKLHNYVVASLLAALVGVSLLVQWIPELYALLITAGIILLGWLKVFAILYLRSKLRH